MGGLETNTELARLDDVLNYLAAEYQFEKYERRRKETFARVRQILRLDRKRLEEYPWIQWFSLWAWLDDRDPESGRTFLEGLLAEEKELPYPEILMKLLFTRVGAYQVTGLISKEEMTLRDLVTAEVYRVQVRPEDLQLPWAVLVGRLYPLKGGVWTGIQEWISFPPYFQILLRDWLKRHFPDGTVPEEPFLKQHGLELIQLAANPPEDAGEEFLLIMDQLQEMLLESRSRFEQNVERLPADLQRLVYETLQYSLWMSALRTGMDRLAFPWEERLARLGSKGDFPFRREIRQQLQNNLKEEGGEMEGEELFWPPDSVDSPAREGEAEPDHQAGEEEGFLPEPLARAITGFQKERTAPSRTIALFARYLRTVAIGEIGAWADLSPEHVAEFLGWWLLSRRLVTTEDQALEAIREMEAFLAWLDEQEGSGKKALCRPVLEELSRTLPLAVWMKVRCGELPRLTGEESPFDYSWYRIEQVEKGWCTATDRETDEQLEMRWEEELASVLKPGFIIQGSLSKEGNGYRLDTVMNVYPPLAWEYVR